MLPPKRELPGSATNVNQLGCHPIDSHRQLTRCPNQLKGVHPNKKPRTKGKLSLNPQSKTQGRPRPFHHQLARTTPSSPLRDNAVAAEDVTCRPHRMLADSRWYILHGFHRDTYIFIYIIYIHIYLFVYLFIHLCIYVFIYLYMYLFICLYMYLFICLFIFKLFISNLSISNYLYLGVCVCLISIAFSVLSWPRPFPCTSAAGSLYGVSGHPQRVLPVSHRRLAEFLLPQAGHWNHRR